MTKDQGAEWIVLGAGSVLPRPGYGNAGYALFDPASESLTVFDCGAGTWRALANAGFGLERITRIVLSHFHLDHCLDLFSLALARMNPDFEGGELELVGPVGTQKFIERAGRALGSVARGFDGVKYLEVAPGSRIASRSLPEYRISTVGTHHNKDSLAWRVDLPSGGSVCYSGDSGEERSVAELARKTSLFVCECSFPAERATPNHLTPAGAGRLAQHAECQRLLLTHFYPSMEPERAAREAAELFSGTIEIARDGRRFPIVVQDEAR